MTEPTNPDPAPAPEPDAPTPDATEPAPEPPRALCASSLGTWPQVQHPDTGEWYCPPDPHTPPPRPLEPGAEAQ